MRKVNPPGIPIVVLLMGLEQAPALDGHEERWGDPHDHAYLLVLPVQVSRAQPCIPAGVICTGDRARITKPIKWVICSM
jgi:hypothetical protein